MKKAALFLVSLILPASVLAQTNCPVLIGKVNPKVTQSWSRVGRSFGNMASDHADARNRQLANTPDFSVEIKNASGKTIRGLKVQAAYFDATEDLHNIPISWEANKSIKVGEDKTLTWSNDLYKGSESDIGWVVVVQKILFEDGSRWEFTSSTPSCYGEYWADKKHPRLTALPEQAKFQNIADSKESDGPTTLSK